jgi:hypothetical protein
MSIAPKVGVGDRSEDRLGCGMKLGDMGRESECSDC